MRLRVLRSSFPVVLMCGAMVLQGYAQQPAAAQAAPQQPIKVQVNEVIVPVTVTDDKGP